ncbi:MAG: RHS repeat domain-containing protein [Parachlamydiaceae bacterium]
MTKKQEDDVGRVKLLKAPVGSDAKPVITHRFFYQEASLEKTRSAVVLDALNHKTEYVWNTSKRLKEVIQYTGTNKYTPYSSQKLFWGKGHSVNVTQLMARTFEDANGNILFSRAFEYDKDGNILVDHLYGNLTGNNYSYCQISKEGKVDAHGCECFSKQFTYSDDGLYLVTSVREGKVTETFEYKPGTDLVVAKLIYDAGKIVKREFYTYDDSAVLVEAIEDNGYSSDRDDLAGVSQRRIRRTTVRDTFPIGLPEVIQELYLDLSTGKEKLLKKTVYHYCDEGHLIAQDLYDADDRHLCTLMWEYDAFGNVTKETNPLGQAIIRRYDISGNKIFEQGPNPETHKEFFYDYSNRLIRMDEVCQNGLTLSETYKYNYLSQKIASVDVYGNETRFEYDAFGRLIKTILPPLLDENKEVVICENATEYNLFNTPSKQIDFNGNVTKIESNIRGKPTHTLYADGSFEEMSYDLDGTLKKIRHRNGSKTKFIYDWKKRLVQKSTFNRQGKLLENLSYTYDAFHLLSETDTAGHVTTYRYNDAGHLVEMVKGESRVGYAYDSVGRLYKTIEYDAKGKNSVHVQVFDLLDRVVEERQEDEQGNCLTKVSYGYDVAGNRTTVTNHISRKKKATTTTVYNHRNQPIQTIDPLGNTTHIHYSYDYVNELGQTVAYTQTTDPMGNITENIHDAQGRLVKVVRRNSLGDILHTQEIFYDRNSNQCRQEDSVTSSPGVDSRKITTVWTYDCMNRNTGIFEAFERPEQKHVAMSYNQHGEKNAIIKADGVSLFYKYDSLGRLKKYTASDQSFAYKYHYDGSGNIISVQDKVHGRTTQRTYDALNRLTQETLANGLTVDCTYDQIGRLEVMTFPDQSGMEYVYNANRLVEVHRLSKDKERVYTHRYKAYDLEDKLLSAKLIGKAGKVKYAYDLSGKPTELKYKAWQECIKAYDKVGNLLEREISEPFQQLSCQYVHDDLYQIIEEKVDSQNVHSYRYDSLYNRTHKDGQKLKMNDLHQLLEDAEAQYSYDPNGNLKRKSTSKGNTYFNYDALDRLIEVISYRKKISYTYDENNRRLSKQVLAKDKAGNWKTKMLRNYLYVGQSEIGSYNAKGHAVELRLLGIGKGAEIGAAVAIEIGKRVYAPLHDHIGNVVGLVDANSGQAVEFYRYTTFGEEAFYNGEGSSLDKSINPWRYASKRVDNETKFIYFGRRYYDPSVGRWATPDPIGRAGGPNCYAYVLNKPLTRYDMFGLYAMAGSFQLGSLTVRFNPSFVQGVNTVGHYLEKGVEYIGRCINAIGFEVPIPGVRDVIQLVGRSISGQGFADYHGTFMGRGIYGDLGLPESYGNIRFLELGGVWTPKNNMIERARETSNIHGGCNVHYYVASSDGLILDLAKAFVRRHIGPLPEDVSLINKVTDVSNEVGGTAWGGCIVTNAHSQAGILCQNLKQKIPEICNMMSISSYGSGYLLNKDDFYDAMNFVSVLDPVPLMASPRAYARTLSCPREDVMFLKSNGIPGVDHLYDSDVYRAVRIRRTTQLAERLLYQSGRY